MNIDFKVTGDVANLTDLDKNNLIIGPKSQDYITMTFFGKQPPGFIMEH
jgi:hypothetical protein